MTLLSGEARLLNNYGAAGAARLPRRVVSEFVAPSVFAAGADRRTLLGLQKTLAELSDAV